MAQETSIESYLSLLYSKKISENQYLVLKALSELGDATDTEITHHLGFNDPNKIRPRRYELVQEGLVEEGHTRDCVYTNKKAIAWVLSGKTAVDDHKVTLNEEQGNFEAVLPMNRFSKVEKEIYQMNLFQLKKIQTILDNRKRYLEGNNEI